MSQGPEEQVKQWLKKLERESWQLELLVSAFTIFLLIAATEKYDEFLTRLTYTYSESTGLVFSFLGMVQLSIVALTIFLVIHLLLRGFWIGAIGLRSVQPRLDFDRLNYSPLFQEKLKKKLIGLDRLVTILDEICSVLFSVSFLVIFMLLSFGLYSLFLLVVNWILGLVIEDGELPLVGWIIIILTLLTGILYMLDYFTLGFFKKSQRFSRIYYPIYKFYSWVTLSVISRSIYYNLISKYTKNRIRLLLFFPLMALLTAAFINFDQYQYYPEGEFDKILYTNYYDDKRNESDYVADVSVESRIITEDFMSLFIRYDPNDNWRIKSNCPDFEPLKNEGFNQNIKILFDNGIQTRVEDFEEEDKERLLQCLSALYEVSINDSVYTNLDYYFTVHPAKDQKGIITTFPTEQFHYGENIIWVKEKYIKSSDSSQVTTEVARVPVWFAKN